MGDAGGGAVRPLRTVAGRGSLIVACASGIAVGGGSSVEVLRLGPYVFQLEVDVCFSVGADVGVLAGGRRWCFSWRYTLVFQLEVDVGVSVGGRRWCFSWR